MKVTLESTNRKLTLNGIQEYRVWEGVTEDGIAFVALVNRLEVLNPAQKPQFVEALSKTSREPSAGTPGVLERLGV